MDSGNASSSVADPHKVPKYGEKKVLSFRKIIQSVGGDSSKFSRRYMHHDDSDVETFFTECLTKWNDQDHSSLFVEFADKLPSDELHTYAQLLHHRKTIVDLLLQYMRDESSKSTPAFCELLTALAKDLKEEFYEHMWESFDVIVHIFDFGERDKDTIESAYFCLSIMVKTLWRKLSKNIKKSFSHFLPLFGNSKDYVRRFAAESIAFLLRKVDNLRVIVDYLVSQAYKSNDSRLIDGMAILFFNVYKGIGGGYHSSASSLLSDIIYGVLSTSDLSQREFGAGILARMLQSNVLRVRSSHATDVNLSIPETLLTSIFKDSDSMSFATDIARLVPILFAERRQKCLFTKTKELHQATQKVLTSSWFALNEDFLVFLSKCIHSLFADNSWNIPVRDLLKVVLLEDAKSPTTVDLQIEAVASFINHGSFDLYLLPLVGSLYTKLLKNHADNAGKLVHLFAKICASRRPITEVLNRDNGSFFDVSQHNALKNYVSEQILTAESLPVQEAGDLIIVWSGIYGLADKVPGVPELVKFLMSLLSIDKLSIETSQLVYILTASLYKSSKHALEDIEIRMFENFIQSQACSESSIRSLLIRLTVSSSVRDVTSMERITNLMMPALFSVNSSSRIAALEVLQKFTLPKEGSDAVDEDGVPLPEPDSVFNILAQAESCNLLDSRGRLMHLRRLNYGLHVKHLSRGLREIEEKAIVTVCLAQYFVQYSLLWPGLFETLNTYARGMNIDVFWAILSDAVSSVTKNCRLHEAGGPSGCFSDLLPNMDSISRQDYISARIQILKFVAKIADLAERRTRFLSPMILDIYQTDYVNRLVKENAIVPISKDAEECETEESGDTEDVDESNLEEYIDSAEGIKILSTKDFVKTITAFMDIFAKFSDARSVYLEPSIRRMYEDLLTYRAPDVQKSALNCIFTYKEKTLAPYRDQLASLHDDKSFIDQLVLFTIDETTGETVLASDHRQTVMPILIRLLYGKLKQKIHGGKKRARRATVFRYLSGCRPEELQIFLSVAFSSIMDIVGSGADMVETMKTLCHDDTVVERIRVPQILEDVRNVAEMVNVSSSVSEDQQSFILRILLTIGVSVRAIIQNLNTPAYRRNQARDLRTHLADSLAAFFSAFPNRIHTPEEVLDVLDICILSDVTKQKGRNDESIPFATESGLRIISSWAAIPSLYHLFAIKVDVCAVPDEKFSVLDIFISPLVVKALTPPMLRIIRSGLLNMLKLADEPMHVLSGVEYVDVAYFEGVNYGTKLMVSHMSKILFFLSESLETDRDPSAFIENLEILNRLSDFIEDRGDLGLKMASTLLGSLERKIPAEDTTVKMFETIGRLVKYVNQPVDFIRRIAPLMSTVLGRNCRESMCCVLIGLSTNKYLDTEIKENLLLSVELEKWDKRRVDEPDHDARHAAYSKLAELWSSSSLVDVNTVVIFAHQHSHLLFNTNDIALRSAATSNFRAMIEYVSRVEYAEEVKTKIVDKTFINLTLRGFHNQLETVREESFRHLTSLVDFYPAHPQLSTLQQLKSKDDDIDFFVNFIHIQLHRRQRALGRLCHQLEDGTVTLPFGVLSQFFLPLTVHYVLKYDSKTSAFSDQCLTLLKITMANAPWSRFASTMDHWLGRIENQQDNDKPIVRAIVAVIDAFHFEVADASVIAEDPDHPPLPVVIRDRIQRFLMPRLQKCINGKGSSQSVHKKARTAEHKQKTEDEDIERAPVILATVKLLMKLPENIASHYLHGVILKMCRLLIAGSITVRQTARKVAIQVVDVLGPKYLPFVIKEMKMIMTAGFHIIVMIFTVHAFISSLQSRLQLGDLDACLNDILELSIKDQFELAGEEKEIGAIRAKTPEAKSNRTPDTFLLLGKFISAGSIGLVLQKLMPVVQTKVSSKNIQRIGDLLTKFAHGVKDNSGLTPHMQLVFVHQVLKENIEKMENVNKKENEGSLTGLRQKSCLIIPEAPKRVGAIVKTSVKSRVHVFVEFSLLLLAQLINDRRFDADSPEDIAGLDPFVPIVTRCLHLKYDKVISHSLKCISGLLHLNLPSLKSQLRNLTERLFVLRADYAVIGNAANKMSILQLNQLIYKSFTQIIKISDASFLEKKHVALLLYSIESDVLDTQRQATAFSLIKTIIKKQIRHESIKDVMKQLSEMSITNQFAHIRTQCRDVICDFIGNHPDAGDPRDHLQFFTAQLQYEYEDGRLSASEALHKLFTTLLSPVLDANCILLVVKLSAAMMNDEVPKCRKFFTLTLRQLLTGISESARHEVASAAYDWLHNTKDSTCCVGVNVLVQLSFVEKDDFSPRLPEVISSMAERFSSDDVFSENSELSLVTISDGIVLMLQNCTAKCLPHVTSHEFHKLIGTIGELSKCPGSTDVRRAASSLLGQALSVWESPLKEDHIPSLATMISWMFWQLRDNKLEHTVAEQCSKNLVCLSSSLSTENFVEFVKSLSGICRFEISHAPKDSIKRITCLKMAAAISVRSENDRLEVILEEFFPLIVRELNRKSKYDTETLYTLASEIGELLKSTLGDDAYNKRLSECQKALNIKTEERKRKAKELVVTAPVEAADLKRKKNLKKTESRKRKLDILKPYRVAKRQNVEKKRLQQDEDDY